METSQEEVQIESKVKEDWNFLSYIETLISQLNSGKKVI